MECACIFNADVDTGDTWEENCKASHVVSKTAHICVECGRKIPPGEKYLLEIVQWGGVAAQKCRYKTCVDCEGIRDHLCCSWIYSTILEDVKGALELIDEDQYPWKTFSKLTPNARAYIFDIIENWWKEEDEKSNQAPVLPQKR